MLVSYPRTWQTPMETLHSPNPEIPKMVKSTGFWEGSEILLSQYEIWWGWNNPQTSWVN